MTDLLEGLYSLSGDRLRAFQLLLSKNQLAPLDLPIAPCSTTKTRLSLAQEHLWAMESMFQAGGAYNIVAGLRVVGALQRSVLRSCLAEICKKHRILTVRFEHVTGEPLQVADPTFGGDYLETDLAELSASARERVLDTEIANEASYAFDLRKGALFRVRLFREAADRHLLIFVVHHIVADGASMKILFEDLTSLYAASVEGRALSSSAPRIQYQDFAEWQRRFIAPAVLERELDYWRRTLSDAPPVFELPTDRKRPALLTFGGARVPIRVTSSVLEGLNRLRREDGATLFMVLLAAFQVLLSRWSGEQEVIVGTPTANRFRPEIEGLVGCFVNRLVLRGSLRGEPTFRELLRRAKEVCRGAYAHQILPFETLVNALGGPRDRSRQPLFQILLALQDIPTEVQVVAGLQFQPLGEIGRAAKYDIALYLNEDATGLRGYFEYATDLYDASTVERLRDHLEVLFGRIAVDPDGRIGDLPVATESERKARIARPLAIPGDDRFVPFRSDDIEQTLTARFESRVSLAPDAQAVRDAQLTWSYRELNARADAIAENLIAETSAGPGFVALLFEQGAAMLAAMLGVLKAGKAYVPLDPFGPAARSISILGDAQAEAVICGAGCLEIARECSQGSLPVIDADKCRSSGIGLSARRSPMTPTYLLYTSGSTGVPKGVIQIDRNVLHFIRTYSNNLRLHAGDRLSLFSSYGFDAAVMDIYGALLNGAALEIYDIRRDGLHGVRTWLAERAITVWHSTPTVFRLACESFGTGAPRSVRLVVLGGEEAHFDDVAALGDHFDESCVLINGYGPTESTVTVQYAVAAGESLRTGRLPIGRPVEATEIVLLDQSGSATDVVGEIGLRSKFLALGYNRLPKLTAERFTPDPYENGARLYRTGDIGRWRSDGSLEFLGRIDDQIKVRGFRIEPGEIEVCLRAHSDVARALVLGRENESREREIVAYIVGRVGATLDSSSMREYLRGRLPDYMVPAAFVFLESFPLTPNGKVDRRMLPAPEKSTPAQDYLEPLAGTEQPLAAIWRSVLGVEQVGRHASFFDLGGHSLMMVRVASQVQVAFGVTLSLRDLFQHDKLSDLAELIDQQQSSITKTDPVVALPRSGRLPLSFSQERLWFIDRLGHSGSTYNEVIGVRIRGPLDRSALAHALSKLVERHEILRTCFPESGGTPSQVVLAPADVAISVVDLSDVAGPEQVQAVREHIRTTAATPFVLETGPLLRSCLLALGVTESVLVVALHHIVSDAWSRKILIQDLCTLYNSVIWNEMPRLETLPIQYVDYAVWQRGRSSDDFLGPMLAYWCAKLEAASPVELTTDHPRPLVQSFRGAREPLHLSESVAAEIGAFTAKEKVTPFIVLLAAFKVALSRWSSQSEITVGVPVAGRVRPEFEALVGFFANLLPLRTNLDGSQTFRGLVAALRESMVEAHSHQEIPFERIVQALRPTRELSRQALVQVQFNFVEHGPEAEISASSFANLEVEPFPIDGCRSRFDVSLYLWPTRDGFRGAIEYATDLFERPTIVQWINQFHRLLTSLLEHPERQISDAELMDEREQEELLRQFSGDTLDVTERTNFVETPAEARGSSTGHAEGTWGTHG